MASNRSKAMKLSWSRRKAIVSIPTDSINTFASMTEDVDTLDTMVGEFKRVRQQYVEAKSKLVEYLTLQGE